MADSEITDITVLILRDICDRLDGTNQRLDTLNERADGLTGEVHVTNQRLEMMNERLSLVEHTVRDAADQIGTVGRIVTNKHDREIESLRKRVSRLEAKASGGGT